MEKKRPTPKPDWLRVRYNPDAVAEVAQMMTSLGLHTVCREANCPNLGECYRKHTATFMIMGSQCTRNCRFCNVVHGKPEPLDPEEPAHIGKAVRDLGLRHAVVTCVTRDDLPDGGAAHFAAVIHAIREYQPKATVEVLISDCKGDAAALDTILAASPDVLNHNVETVAELYDAVRPQAKYDRSLAVLRYCHEKRSDIHTKTGFMVGLGETDAQITRLMRDVRDTGCEILTIGQYLQPSPAHYPLARYVTPAEFDTYKKEALDMGFRFVSSGPFVRSSYQAVDALDAMARDATAAPERTDGSV